MNSSKKIREAMRNAWTDSFSITVSFIDDKYSRDVIVKVKWKIGCSVNYWAIK